MLYHDPKTNDFSNHVHIPRTGGRFISTCFLQSGFIEQFPPRHLYNGKEMMHLPVADMNTITSGENIKYQSFAVIRNPIEKFKSSYLELYSILGKIIKMNILEDYDLFKDLFNNRVLQFSIGDPEKYYSGVVYKGIRNSPNNWFKSQVEFINKNVKLWKFENGLDKNFESWVIEEVGIKNFSIDIKDVNGKLYETDHFDQKRKKISKKILENVEKYYAKDMELWDSIP